MTIPQMEPWLGEEEAAAVNDYMRSGGWLMEHDKTRKFESIIADYTGASHCIVTVNGTVSLTLAALACDVTAGDEVIVPNYTMIATANSAFLLGARPIFVDVEPDTFNVDVSRIEEMITPETRAMMFPNLIGNAPDWDAIRAIADRHGLPVIEDSCDALGATLRGTPTGTRSDISVTSFALAHIITAAATGGMVLLDDDEWIDRCLLLRRWGRRSEPQFFGTKKGDRQFFTDVDGIEYDNLFIFDEVGWNFEPCEISAAFGNVQLRRLPANLGGDLPQRRTSARASAGNFPAGGALKFYCPRVWLCSVATRHGMGYGVWGAPQGSDACASAPPRT